MVGQKIIVQLETLAAIKTVQPQLSEPRLFKLWSLTKYIGQSTKEGYVFRYAHVQ